MFALHRKKWCCVEVDLCLLCGFSRHTTWKVTQDTGSSRRSLVSWLYLQQSVIKLPSVFIRKVAVSLAAFMREGICTPRDAVIVSLYKSKGDKSDCSNSRGITLLSFAGKILARILLNRPFLMIAQENAPESRCGFRSNRGTADLIFVLWQIQEKCRE